jgi:hypothetical protein
MPVAAIILSLRSEGGTLPVCSLNAVARRCRTIVLNVSARRLAGKGGVELRVWMG